jgi:hypothetical protein
MSRYRLRADRWERIKDLLPGKVSDRGATTRDNRLFVEAVLGGSNRSPLAYSARFLWQLASRVRSL